jgi:hypothetical protein
MLHRAILISLYCHPPPAKTRIAPTGGLDIGGFQNSVSRRATTILGGIP